MKKKKKNYMWWDPFTQIQNEDHPSSYHLCAEENCSELGEFKAPISNQAPGKYQFFCEKHITEFNKRWNYFDGMDMAQLKQEMETQRLGGVSWPMGVKDPADHLKLRAKNIDDIFQLFKKNAEKKAGNAGSFHEEIFIDLTEGERKAAQFLALEPPFDKEELKKSYRKMARKYHPDSQNKEADEDKLKKVNEAYALLKKTLQI